MSVNLSKEAVSESIELVTLRRTWTIRGIRPKDTLERLEKRGPPPEKIKYEA